jgi:arginine utilization regulatory protein
MFRNDVPETQPWYFKSHINSKELQKEYKIIIKALNCLHNCYFSVVDATGKLIFLSEDFEKIDGFNVNDILGKNVLDVYKLGLENSVHMIAINEKRILKNTPLRYLSTDGQPVRLLMDIFPIFSGDEVIGSVAISYDKSKTQELTDKLLKLQKLISKHRYGSNDNGTVFCFDDIIGSSNSIKNAINTAKRIACSESRVMILGETGTGKELFAQSIHNYSARSSGPFIAINCSAIPETLLENTLFGTTKGAFTGAENKAGLFEEAKDGTLFLDEINSMSPILQSKLLRALETNRIRRLGSNHEIPVNPRIISAMNMDPNEAIDTKSLRSDFYYRLAVVTLEIPPLRGRGDDIITLSWHYINKYNKILGRKVDEIYPEVLHILENYKWPGNVRELNHCIEHAMNIIDPYETSLLPEYLPSFLQDSAFKNDIFRISIPKINNYNEIILQVEKDILTQALRRNKCNISQTAKELNLSRQCLFYKIKRLKIDIQHEVTIN